MSAGSEGLPPKGTKSQLSGTLGKQPLVKLRVGYKPSVHLAPAGNHERKPWSEKPLPEASHMAKPVVQRAFPAQVRPVQITRGLAPCHTVTVSHLTPERVLDVPSCHCTLIQSRVISRPSWDHIRATCSSWVTSGSWARLT